MAQWRKTVRIRDLIVEDESPEAIIALADGIIKRLPDAPHDRLVKAKAMAHDDPETALLVVNAGLNDVYDWADYARVWLN